MQRKTANMTVESQKSEDNKYEKEETRAQPSRWFSPEYMVYHVIAISGYLVFGYLSYDMGNSKFICKISFA